MCVCTLFVAMTIQWCPQLWHINSSQLTAYQGNQGQQSTSSAYQGNQGQQSTSSAYQGNQGQQSTTSAYHGNQEQQTTDLAHQGNQQFTVSAHQGNQGQPRSIRPAATVQPSAIVARRPGGKAKEIPGTAVFHGLMKDTSQRKTRG